MKTNHTCLVVPQMVHLLQPNAITPLVTVGVWILTLANQFQIRRKKLHLWTAGSTVSYLNQRVTSIKFLPTVIAKSFMGIGIKELIIKLKEALIDKQILPVSTKGNV